VRTEAEEDFTPAPLRRTSGEEDSGVPNTHALSWPFGHLVPLLLQAVTHDRMTSSSVPLSFELESLAHLLDRPPLDKHTFLPASRSTQDLYGAERHVTVASKEPAQFLVRCSVGRGGRHADFQSMAVDAGRLGPGGPRLNMHGDHYSGGHGANHLSFDRRLTLSHRNVGAATNRTVVSEDGLHHFDDAAQHVRIVGNWTGYGDFTSLIGRHPLLDQRRRVDQ